MNSGELFPIEKSTMYQELLLERQEIEKLRWIESEKVGHDIGLWRAEWLWWAHHQRSWRATQMMKLTGQK
jgi:hypothetical protein